MSEALLFTSAVTHTLSMPFGPTVRAVAMVLGQVVSLFALMYFTHNNTESSSVISLNSISAVLTAFLLPHILLNANLLKSTSNALRLPKRAASVVGLGLVATLLLYLVLRLISVL